MPLVTAVSLRVAGTLSPRTWLVSEEEILALIRSTTLDYVINPKMG